MTPFARPWPTAAPAISESTGDCSFTTKGEGRFKAHEGANPFIGSVGNVETVAEERIETIVPERGLKKVLKAMIAAHPYEEPAYDIYPLKNAGHPFTMGRVGNWPTPEPAVSVLRKIKDLLHRDALSYAGNTDVTVRRVALLGGGGAGSSNWQKNAGADLYLTGDVKYHDARKPLSKVSSSSTAVTSGRNRRLSRLCRRLRDASEERQWGIDCQRDPTSQDMIQYII